MKMKSINALTFLILSLLFSKWLYAIDFSATAVETDKYSSNTSLLFVSGKSIRMEYELENEKYIQISNPSQKKLWVLIPNQKSYFEKKSVGDLLPKNKKIDILAVCKKQSLKCKKVKKEKISNRLSEHWLMEKTVNNKKTQSHIWIDSKYKIPLRQEFPNGNVAEMIFQGVVEVEKRKVQKWKFIATTSGGKSIEVLQWYDPELNLTIKEQYADGSLKELKNIKVEKQQKKLFEVPKNYLKIQ